MGGTQARHLLAARITQARYRLVARSRMAKRKKISDRRVSHIFEGGWIGGLTLALGEPGLGAAAAPAARGSMSRIEDAKIVAKIVPLSSNRMYSKHEPPAPSYTAEKGGVVSLANIIKGFRIVNPNYRYTP